MKGTSHDHRVSVRELAALLRVSTDTIRRAYRRGDLHALRPKSYSHESTPIGKGTAWQPEPATLLPLRQGVVAPPATKAGSVPRVQEPLLGQASAAQVRRHTFERNGEQRETLQ